MSALVLKLEGHAQHVRTTTTSDGQEVFSIINFIQLVCNGKSKNYAGRLWSHLKPLPEMEGLVVDVPLRVKSPPTPYKPPAVTRVGPATTRAGLQQLLLVLDDKVHDDFRKVGDSDFTRFMGGDRSRFIDFDFSSKVPRKERKVEVTRIHYNHYNFMPPVYTPNNQ
jgi:hypothetical protein